MEQQLSIIDIFCGIGGMSKGFLDAGYEVRQAIDNDKEKVSIYESIFGRNTSKCQDICLLQPEELKDADIITGRISLSALSAPVKRRGVYSYPINDWMINLVREKRPKAIVLETAGAGLNRMREACACYINMGYHIHYKLLAAQNYSGLPFDEVKAYIVGIREDLYNREFYFPAACFNKNDIKGYWFEKNVDPWYRQIRGIEHYRFEKNKIYVRQRNKIYESNLFMNGAINENFICDDKGLRRCTHIEMARLKGLEIYDYNKCQNKIWMYRYISQATNAIVISYIAKALSEYLGGKETNGNATTCFSKEQLPVKKYMKLLVADAHDEKIDLEENVAAVQRHKICDSGTDGDAAADCPRDEWGELIEAVNAEKNSNTERGRALEELMFKFFSEVEGFQCQHNVITETEEIDISIYNGSENGVFAKESTVILCECKNWRQVVGREELNIFIGKMKNRYRRCKLGFFIAWNGVTDDFDEELLRFSHDEEVVVLLTQEGIVSAIRTGNITKYLQDEFLKTVMR